MQVKQKMARNYIDTVESILEDFVELFSRVENINSDKPLVDFSFVVLLCGVDVETLKRYVSQMAHRALGVEIVRLDITHLYKNSYQVSAAMIRPASMGSPSLKEIVVEE